jgi:hypothetical protein
MRALLIAAIGVDPALEEFADPAHFVPAVST